MEPMQDQLLSAVNSYHAQTLNPDMQLPSFPTSTPKPAITYISPPTTRLFPPHLQTLADPNHPQPPRYEFPALSLSHVKQCAHILSLLALVIILYRTYRYVHRRRSGLVGPSAAPLLLKFWSLYGFIEVLAQLLSLYLSPLQADWLISSSRALILLLLISGPRLRIAETLYDRKLVPFFDAHAQEIETQFAAARKYWDQVNEAFRELATYLLKRIAVGGLANAVVVPSAEEETQAASAPSRDSSERETGAPLPKETAVFPTARTFFAGQAEQRADTVVNARAGSMGGAIQVTLPEPPRPAYEESRAMRERFRSRLKKSNSSKAKGPLG